MVGLLLGSRDTSSRAQPMAMRGTLGSFDGLVPVAGSSTLSVGGSDISVIEVVVTAVDDVVDV